MESLSKQTVLLLAQGKKLSSDLLIAFLLITLVGSLVAFFLWSLDKVIIVFWRFPQLLYALPFAGAVTGWIYQQYGKRCEAGNNQLYHEIRHGLMSEEPTEQSALVSAEDPQDITTPLIMAPLVLLGTLLTHLCGGSAGREGTALQVGGSIASWLTRLFKLTGPHKSIVIQAGVAAGFGAVFGTPLAATIFAIEVIGLRFARWRSIVFALLCAVGADCVSTLWGIRHTEYRILADSMASLNLTLTAKLLLAGVAFGQATILFLSATRLIAYLLGRFVERPWLRPAIGGTLIVAVVMIYGGQDYLGLGVRSNPDSTSGVSIVTSFDSGGAASHSWLSKLAMTALTIGSGLKGGEATPLFFIGSTLGNALSGPLHLPVDVLAGLGFVALFAAATRTPLACTMMAIELFQLSGDSAMVLAAQSLICCGVATSLRRLTDYLTGNCL